MQRQLLLCHTHYTKFHNEFGSLTCKFKFCPKEYKLREVDIHKSNMLNKKINNCINYLHKEGGDKRTHFQQNKWRWYRKAYSTRGNLFSSYYQ